MINPLYEMILFFFYPISISWIVNYCLSQSTIGTDTELKYPGIFEQRGKNILIKFALVGDLVRQGTLGLHIVSLHRLLPCLTREVRAGIHTKQCYIKVIDFLRDASLQKRQDFETSLVKTMYTLKQTFKRPRSADEALR